MMALKVSCTLMWTISMPGANIYLISRAALITQLLNAILHDTPQIRKDQPADYLPLVFISVAP
jgi:hypothetical protein